MERPRGNHWIVLMILLIGVLVLQIAGFHDLRHDDAYITFRYAENLATGRGLVFNPGESVMGSTSPGHALIGAGLHSWLGHDRLPTAMSWLGCVGWAAQAAAVYVLVRRALGSGIAVFVAASLAAGAAWSMRFVALETNLVAALALWSIVALDSRRWYAAAGLCALAGLVRPDAFLLAVPLIVACASHRGTRVAGPAAWGAVITAPWFVFAIWKYGTPLPQSAIAKIGLYSEGDYIAQAISYALAGPAFPAVRWQYNDVLGWTVAGCMLMFAVIGAVTLVRARPSIAVLPVYGVLLLIAYLVMQPSPGVEWHLYPVLVLVVTCALSGLGICARRLPPRVASWAGVLLVAAFAARTAVYAYVHPDGYWYGARDDAYIELARILRESAGPGDAVASSEVGTIAYHSGLVVVDLAGLVSREGRDAQAAECRFFVDVPAYDSLYGAERASGEMEWFRSKKISELELHPEGVERFECVLVDRNRR